ALQSRGLNRNRNYFWSGPGAAKHATEPCTDSEGRGRLDRGWDFRRSSQESGDGAGDALTSAPDRRGTFHPEPVQSERSRSRFPNQKFAGVLGGSDAEWLQKRAYVSVLSATKGESRYFTRRRGREPRSRGGPREQRMG